MDTSADEMVRRRACPRGHLIAPFDVISVAAGSPQIPPALVAQWNDPGILVIPVGDRDGQDLRVVRRKYGKITTRTASGCRFVPLVGSGGWQKTE